MKLVAVAAEGKIATLFAVADQRKEGTRKALSDMWMAVFADIGVSLMVVANGLRMLKSPK